MDERTMMQPQQYGQPPAQAPAPYQFAGPTGMGDGTPKPNIRHLENRAVALIAVELTSLPSLNDQNQKVDAIRFDVVIMDGGPLLFGDDQTKRTPPSMRVDTMPWRADGCITANTEIVRELRPYVGTRMPLIGRIVLGKRSSKGNPPWLLAKLGSQFDPQRPDAPIDPQPQAADQVRSQLAQYFGMLAAGQVPPNPAPVSLNAPAPAYPAAAPAPQVQYPGYAPQPAAAAPAPIPPPPPGWDPAQWVRLSPEDRARFA